MDLMLIPVVARVSQFFNSCLWSVFGATQTAIIPCVKLLSKSGFMFYKDKNNRQHAASKRNKVVLIADLSYSLSNTFLY